MKGSQKVVDQLKFLLTGELTAMDVYFIQYRVLKDWGLDKVAARLEHEFDDEKMHADQLIDRILFLEGMPDMAAREPFDVGNNVQEVLANDLDLELLVAKNLKVAIKICEEESDFETRSILLQLLKDTEEDHIKWLEIQLKLIKSIGMERYSQSQMEVK
ncbi:bacterioferritin [Halobacteriovorax marinus]|uniref:Bacterioferritin n=1 Tax=Halobacteriovorax marinus TaxID=97084 RepID=A0A1Y5FCE4_9BACT|nr:bacterioferritin [Halobacteriovorax marinus]